ncbi:MAG: hypothetical protein AAF841_02055 [Pseudomonadota bacterium]
MSVALGALVLTGCESIPAFSFVPDDILPETAPIATQEITLRSGMVIRAPFGKCIDTRRTRQSGGTATVIMANCSNLGGREDIGAIDPGLILVTVTPASHGDLLALRTAVRDDPGLLARSGAATDVDLIAIKTSRAALYANLVDISPGGPEGVSARHWKAALDVTGRGVVISVFGQEDGPLPAGAGESLARDVAQSLLEANSASADAQSESGIETTVETPAESAENTPQAVFRRIFGRP